MSGRSKLEDSSCINHCNETLKSQELKWESYFVELVSGFLKDTSGSDCFRPLPPRLGNGHCVDLLQLFLIVKQRGGFESVSEKNLWDEVGLEFGLGSSFGPAFKLIYVKYLCSLDSWLVNLDKEEDLEIKLLREFERYTRCYVSEVTDGKSGINFAKLMDEGNENESKDIRWRKLVMDFADSDCLNERNDEFVKSKEQDVKICYTNFGDINGRKCEFANDGVLDENHNGNNPKQVKSETSSVDGISSDGSENRRFSASPVVADDEVKSLEQSIGFKKCLRKDEEEEMMDMDCGTAKEVPSHKRKLDCFLGMLRWMANVAKDPTDLVTGKIAERSKRALYGNNNNLKQALLAREALFSEKILVQSTDQFGCQKKQKVTPSLFNHSDNLTTSYQTESNPPRSRQRLEAQLDKQPTALIYTSRPQQRIPVGKAFQAELPKFTGVCTESDSKWLGTKIWPLEKTENRVLIERDPIGKGRTDSCGCQFPGSIECIKFHVSERRLKTRVELGSAFYAWNFSQMGENCSISWTAEEEKKFKDVVMVNRKSSLKCFWEPMCKALPRKRWADQVNYYYNVFKLRRRGYQNRHCLTNIDSDDDETEYCSTTNSNSINHGSS